MDALRHLPVQSLEDVTHNFEQLAQQLAELNQRLAGGPSKGESPALPAAGKGVLKWTASFDSAQLEVTHGLGREPKAVVATAYNSPTFEEIPLLNVVGFDATHFKINGETKKSITAEISFSWIAY